MLEQRQPGRAEPQTENDEKPPITRSDSIEPEPDDGRPQVTVQTSALVDDLGPMHFQVYDDETSFYFGNKEGDNIHIAFTDRSLMNLAMLVNRALRATLQARGIPMTD